MSRLPAPPEVRHSEWAQRLAEHFFRPEYASVHVMFFVDGACLGKLAGAPIDEVVSQFVRAVAVKLRRDDPRQLFARLEHETLRWKLDGGEGPPPCLPVLGLTVLAATHMGRAGERAGHNYYDWLMDLLELGDVRAHIDDVRHSYGQSMPDMWRALMWWLDDKHRGQLGLSTVTSHDHRVWMGYADSQTLFESSDRDKLSRFFRWVGLKRHEPMDERELLQYFRIWSARRDDLNLGTQIMLSDDAYPAQLAALLHAAADGWEGAVRDEEGRYEGILAIALTPRLPQPTLRLAAPREPGFPAALVVRLPIGREIELQIDEETAGEHERQWYDGLDLELTPNMLEMGLKLVSGRHVLRLPCYQLHILHKSRELGCWASRDTVLPGEPAWLLVRNRSLPRVTEFLREHAHEGWGVIERPGAAPRGWTLVRDVTIDAAPSTTPDDLRRLVPRTTNRLMLRGGLRLPHGTDVYLTGGEPDVALPSVEESQEEVRMVIDDVALPMQRESAVVSLAGRDLREGHHQVEIEGIARVFSTVRTLGHTAPTPIPAVGHSIGVDKSGLRPASLDARVQAGGDEREDEILVTGATVRCVEGVLGVTRPPLVLPVKAVRRTLLGACAGEIEQPLAPDQPAWMAEYGLQYRVFEHTPGFAVVWVIIVSQWRGAEIRSVDSTREPEGASPGAAEERVLAWCEAIRSVEAPVDPAAEGQWQRYAALAEDLVR